MRRTGRLFRRLADRIDLEHAPRRALDWSFTIERGEYRMREDGRGCPLWYLGDSDYERAHAESDATAADEARRAHLKALADGLTVSTQEAVKRLSEAFGGLGKAMRYDR